jgi:hypothetical protein
MEIPHKALYDYLTFFSKATITIIYAVRHQLRQKNPSSKPYIKNLYSRD